MKVKEIFEINEAELRKRAVKSDVYRMHYWLYMELKDERVESVSAFRLHFLRDLEEQSKKWKR